MFDPKKEVPSLELCKRLKELGYPQDGGGWYWDLRAEGFEKVRFFERTPKKEIIKAGFYLKAPTVVEMGEWLPENWNIVSIRYGNGHYGISSHELKSELMWEADTEANARAKLLIWLVENGHMGFEKEEK